MTELDPGFGVFEGVGDAGFNLGGGNISLVLQCVWWKIIGM